MSVSIKSPENIMEIWLSKADWASHSEDNVVGFLSIYCSQNATSRR